MRVLSYIIFVVGVFPFICSAFEMEPEMKQYLDTAEVSEDGVPSGTIDLADFPFRDYVCSNWRSVLDNIETIAPLPRQQSVLVATATLLPSNVYLQFIEEAINKSEQGKISKTVIRNGVIFPGPLRYGFLASNYQNSSVQSMCEKVKQLFPNDDQVQNYVIAILTGEARTEAEKWALENNRSAPEMLAVTSSLSEASVNPENHVDNGLPALPTLNEPTSSRTDASSKFSAAVQNNQPQQSSPWPWVIGALLFLAVLGSMVFKFLRK